LDLFFLAAAGGVAVQPEERRHGEPALGDERRIIGAVEHAALQASAPRIATREQAVARGRADGGAAVGIGERHPLRGEAVEMRGLDLAALGIERLHIAVAQIVGEYVNDVGLRRGGGRNVERSRAEEETE
jgi:hypothetical protein